MAPTRVSKRGSEEKPSHGKRTAVAKPSGLSRELAGLRSWSGWKGPRDDDSSDEEDDDDDNDGDDEEYEGEIEDEGYKSKSYSFSDSQSEQSTIKALNKAKEAENEPSFQSTPDHPVFETALDISNRTVGNFIFEDAEDAELATALNIDLGKIARDREEADDTVVVSSPSEAASPTSVPSPDAHPFKSVEDKAAWERLCLAGPRCSLCLCPVNGAYFPVIQCVDCDRHYHYRCIGYLLCDQYHPFHGSSISEKDRCEGCGCPAGENLDVYVGHPSILFHRRDQDPDFREYFRLGSREEAKIEHLE